MKVTRVMKIKVSGSTKVSRILPMWQDCCNRVSAVVYSSRNLNSNNLHRQMYPELRSTGLPSQLSCSCFKTVTACYKALKSKGRWSKVEFSKPVIKIVYGRDFNRSKRGVTLWGEKLTLHESRTLPEVWKDSTIKLTPSGWVLNLCYELEVPEPRDQGCIVGVDMGVKRLLVATNSSNTNTFFFHGSELNHRRSCIRKTRAAVQSVGTKSSKRLLKRLSGNEAAVTAHMLHKASKALVAYSVSCGARKIVLEDLTNIRDSSISKGKNLRSKIHRWPYALVGFMIGYKAQSHGIQVERVSPKNTSRGCPLCGSVSASNRKGLTFLCEKCGHRDDADRNASINVRLRSVSVEHNSALTGSNKSPEGPGKPEATQVCPGPKPTCLSGG